MNSAPNVGANATTVRTSSSAAQTHMGMGGVAWTGVARATAGARRGAVGAPVFRFVAIERLDAHIPDPFSRRQVRPPRAVRSRRASLVFPQPPVILGRWTQDGG